MITRQGQQRSMPAGSDGFALHWPRTLQQKGAQRLASEHLRWQRRRSSGCALHCFVLDCSGSMVGGNKLALAKGLLQVWAQHIYQQRGYLCVVGFNGNNATLLQPPHRARHANTEWIEKIPGGGGTPITQALQLSERIAMQTHKQTPSRMTTLWLLTDGRFSDLPPSPASMDQCTVVDFENSPVRLGRAYQMAQQWQADYLSAEEQTELFQPHHPGGYRHAH